MGQLDKLHMWLENRIPELLVEYDVPGLSVAIGLGPENVAVAHGLLNRATGVSVTTDSLFQIGSITKVWTATLAMQAMEDGLLDLDAPVRDYVPNFWVTDRARSQRVTIRHLLTHTAGFEGDVFTDTGKGDDCVEKFVEALHEVPWVFEPGEMFAYNNAGFCVLGRVIEAVRGRPYDDCLRAGLVEPLGLAHVACDPYEAVLHRTAVGHPGHEPTTTWALARSNAPAGSMLSMSATDLLAFARLHLHGGSGPGDVRLLQPTTVTEMQHRQVDQPPIGQGTGWGLGWELWDLPHGRMIGHDGSTIGQSGYLRIVPDHDLAIAILANGGSMRPVHAEIGGRVLRELAGIDVPAPPRPDPSLGVANASRYLGTYESLVSRTTIAEIDGHLWLERVPLGVLADIGEPTYRSELVDWGDGVLIPLTPEDGIHAPMAFLGDDGGRARYLHSGRVDRRIDG